MLKIESNNNRKVGRGMTTIRKTLKHTSPTPKNGLLKKQTILTQKNRIASKNVKQTFFEDVFEAKPAATAWIFFSAKKGENFFCDRSGGN